MTLKKLTRQEINEKLTNAGNLLVQEKSHAYAHGVFHSSLVGALAELPLHKQLEILHVISSLALKKD